MMRTNLTTNAALTVIFSAALAIPLAAKAQTVFPPARNYEVHELTLNGSGCLVTDIDRGMAVGLCNLETPRRAFAWTAARGLKAITPTTVTAVATSVANGRAVGWYHSAGSNGQRIFMWTRERGLVDVTPRGLQGSRPVGIDARGRIAVLYEDENPLNTRSFVLVPRGL